MCPLPRSSSWNRLSTAIQRSDAGGLGPLLEDAVDEGGQFGTPGAGVPSGGLDGGLAEERLDLGGVGAALATGGVGVAEPVGAEAGDSGVFPGG